MATFTTPCRARTQPTAAFYRQSSEALELIANDENHPFNEQAIEELDRRADEPPHEDTPSLDAPWWEEHI